MSQSTEIAEQVAGWTGLGIKLPKELAEAIEVFEALKWTEVVRAPVFDIDTVTTKNAEAKIRELADQLVLLEVPGGGLSTLQKAKMQALEAAARVVRNWGVHAFPDVIRQLTPQFDEHVEAYTEAVAKLPEDITAETLVSRAPTRSPRSAMHSGKSGTSTRSTVGRRKPQLCRGSSPRSRKW
jgi:hypothetical protein